ncbi:unnamed protein product [Adineta ricciae]|uniref:Uncharacterized protein n=1 Tax=Adineta ricciae TaxID=249248 RepID=A0A815JRQ9_ADIRI|nr:unnamed protein product [Adineta ricciae]CAF1383432.1 unnamed protein product [Adineta ricciae]
MRLSIGLALVFAAIAFVQGKPLLNQLVSQANLPNQLNGIQDFLGQYQGVLNQLQGLVNGVSAAQLQALVQQAANNVSSAQLQSIVQQASQLAQSVLSGQVDVNTALNQVSNFVQQLLSGSAGLTRPANVKALPLNGVQDLLNQYANILSQFQGLGEQVANALSQAQLQTLGQQVAQLAQSVVSGQVGASAAGSQLLALVQQYLDSNAQLYNAVANAVQQLLNVVEGN